MTPPPSILDHCAMVFPFCEIPGSRIYFLVPKTKIEMGEIPGFRGLICCKFWAFRENMKSMKYYFITKNLSDSSKLWSGCNLHIVPKNNQTHIARISRDFSRLIIDPEIETLICNVFASSINIKVTFLLPPSQLLFFNSAAPYQSNNALPAIPSTTTWKM